MAAQSEDYVEIRLGKESGDIIAVLDNGKEIEPRTHDDIMPLKNLGIVSSLDVAVIYHASPGTICFRGKCWTW